MRKRRHAKLVHEGQYVAEVEVDLVETDEGWSPYLSLEDAYKLDDVRAALRRGDLKSAARLSRVFSLTPVRGAPAPARSTRRTTGRSSRRRKARRA
jgi:hypothetical protein